MERTVLFELHLEVEMECVDLHNALHVFPVLVVLCFLADVGAGHHLDGIVLVIEGVADDDDVRRPVFLCSL